MNLRESVLPDHSPADFIVFASKIFENGLNFILFLKIYLTKKPKHTIIYPLCA